MATKFPDNEMGTVPGLTPTYSLTHGNGYMADPLELVPELAWPNSIHVYDKMRKSDGQFGGLLRAMTLPIQNAKWDLNTDGVRDEVVELVRTELGIQPPDEGRQRRRREGIVWKDHVREASLMLPFGHMAFEQVYSVSAPTDQQKNLDLKRVVHLRKLAPRYPRTITEIRVDRDGGLVGIFQNQPPFLAGQQQRFDPIFIPVDRLVFYVLDREGGDWYGTSIFRTAYRDYFLKDILIRLSGQVLERTGMGLPVVHYDPQGEVTKYDALQIARSARGGADAGVALPTGVTFELVGVNGHTPDMLPYIKYHDEAASRSVLAMFMDLGHDNGARSLGETFVDVFTDNLQFYADQIADTATEHVVRDLVEYNYGPNEPYPTITAGNMKENREVSSTVVNTLTTAGILTPDGDLEDFMRQRYGLPKVNEARRPEPVVPAAAPGALRAVPTETTAASENHTERERFQQLLMRAAELDPSLLGE